MPENKETLYWTIGGVAIALIALFAMSRGSSSTTTEGGGVSSSQLLTQAAQVNANANASQQNLVNAEEKYAQAATENQLGALQAFLGSRVQEEQIGAQVQMNEVNNQTERIVSQYALQSSEYKEQQNALTAQAQIAAQQSEQKDANALALQEAQIAETVAHFQSDNAVTMARINHKSWFDSLMGNASGILSGLAGIGLKI